MTPAGPDLDQLATPLAWATVDARIGGCNLAFARWLGVGQRRLLGLPLRALAADAGLDAALDRDAEPTDAPLRLRRLGLRFADGAERFADCWLTRSEDGWLLEAHPVDEFPDDDPSRLPSALSAALRGLAHELRNPLAGLKGAAQLLGRRLDAHDADGQALTALIDAETARLTALLDRLLSPAPAAPHAPLNVHGVLERVLRLAESDAGWAVRLVRDYDPSLPDVEGDADRLTQAAWNLVRNAIEAGASQVTLRTRAEHAARIGEAVHALALRVDIADDGRGVPADLAERLFLPLVSGRAEGTGLGLALAQQVAREHRGALSYRSRPGHTVFTLLLPLQEASDA
jgi:two-component system nitrogen regulation sensor histidine kinase GlnL